MDSGSVVTWSGVASCGVSVLLYLLSENEGRKTKELERAKPLKRLDDVWELARFVPILIAVRGRAGSEDPIQAEMSGTSAVLAEVTEELNALKQNEKGEWLPDRQLIRHQKWETEWYLTDPSRTRLGVEKCQQADFLWTTMLLTAQEYREANSSLYSRVLDRLTGYRPLGMKKSERVLPVGSLITVVGELAQSSEAPNKLVIRRPQGGGPFYITQQTLTELHTSLSTVASACKWLAVGFGALGAVLIATRIWKSLSVAYRYRRIRKRIEEEERRRRIQQARAAARGAELVYNESAEQEEREGMCVACREREAQIVFIPCGHLCCCEMCGRNLDRCPMCRSRSQKHRVYTT